MLIKDLVEVAGVRTTYGSPIFQDHVPEFSAWQVERIEAAGGIVLGKTNTPEFGAGANTFNEVFGITRNPWNRDLTCGGSSGGAAVALATGMAWLADGSDLGGSLRTPASFCGVVGLAPLARPGARRAAQPALRYPQRRGADGPRRARCRPVPGRVGGLRPARSPDLRRAGGGLRGRGRAAAPAAARGLLGRSGRHHPGRPRGRRDLPAGGRALQRNRGGGRGGRPDLGSATATFTTLRAAQYAADKAPLLDAHRAQLKPEVIWNIEHGLSLTALQIGEAERQRGLLQLRMAEFLASYDLLLCPTAIVPPFPVEQRFLAELNGHRFPSYIDWVAMAYAITLTGCPALSLPCGFTAAGLPVGLQMVGKPRGEAGLLAAAAMLEDTLGLAARVPIDPRPMA